MKPKLLYCVIAVLVGFIFGLMIVIKAYLLSILMLILGILIIKFVEKRFIEKGLIISDERDRFIEFQSTRASFWLSLVILLFLPVILKGLEEAGLNISVLKSEIMNPHFAPALMLSIFVVIHLYYRFKYS